MKNESKETTGIGVILRVYAEYSSTQKKAEFFFLIIILQFE